MSLLPEFGKLLEQFGSDATFHRDSSLTPCPCLTPEGFRNPEWHVLHPLAQVCNFAGMLPDPNTSVDLVVKAFVQPVQASAVRRMTNEAIVNFFGEVQADDHIGIFPVRWLGTVIDFYDWGRGGEDWVEYNNRRYNAVAVNLIPDPSDGNPAHHWEIGLRLVSG